MLVWIASAVALAVLLRVILRYSVGKCTSQANMTGKVVIVTGSNTGIGFHTARDLATRGARVILACRNETKGTTARDKIIQETGNNDVVFKQLDLASLTSVRKFCEDIIKTEERLDVLVNNAGVYGLGDRYTEDGILEGMQINCFAPFLLTDLLLPLLKKSKPSRIVNVSSLIYIMGNFNVEKANEIGYFGDVRTYSTSKFCNMLFTVELARRLKDSGVTVNACHPGIVLTSILDKNSVVMLDWVYWALCWFCYRSAEEGAQTPVFVAVSEACGRASGEYYQDCARWPRLWTVNNRNLARNYWAVAEKLLKYKPVNMN